MIYPEIVKSKPLPLDGAIEKFFRSLRAARKSEHTLRDYGHTLALLLDCLGPVPVAEITAGNLEDFLAEQTEISDKTLLNYYMAISSLLSWCVNRRYCEEHVIRRVDTPRPEKREIHPFTQPEVSLLIRATEKSLPYQRAWDGKPVTNQIETGERDKAILYLLLDTGMRATELCNLRLRDLGRGDIYVFGKGDRERYLPASDHTWDLVRGLLRKRPSAKADEPVFLTDDGDRPLTRFSLNQIMERLERRAGVPDTHAHRFRHTFAITYLRNGGDPYTLQKLLGHSSMDMVKRYLEISQVDLQNGHWRCSPVKNWGL